MTMLNWLHPNMLTWGRIAAAPLVAWLMYLDRPGMNFVAFILFSLACITDYVDGQLARSQQRTSEMGRVLDPVADKLIVITVLIMRTASQDVTPLPVILMFSRELAVSVLRQMAATEGLGVPVSQGARWKTTLLIISCGFLILRHNPWGIPSLWIGTLLLWLGIGFAWYTAWVYFSVFLKRPPKSAPAPQTDPVPPDPPRQ